MQKEFACRDAGMDCDYKARGENEEEVLKKAEQHGLEAHGIKDFNDDLKQKVRSSIHDVRDEQQPETKIA